MYSLYCLYTIVYIFPQYGQSVLMYATLEGHTETVNVLVAAGADLNTQDRVCIVSTVCVY